MRIRKHCKQFICLNIGKSWNKSKICLLRLSAVSRYVLKFSKSGLGRNCEKFAALMVTVNKISKIYAVLCFSLQEDNLFITLSSGNGSTLGLSPGKTHSYPESGHSVLSHID